MKKSLFVLVVTFFLYRAAFGQLTPKINPADVKNVATLIKMDTNQLVTDYTFRRTFADEFAKIISTDNFSTSATKYATINIDEEKSTFAFSPWVQHWGDQEKGEPLTSYFNLSIKGEVNSDDIATLFNDKGFNRNLQIGFNYNYLLNKSSRFHDVSAADMRQFRDDKKSLLSDVETYYTDLLTTPAKPLSFLENKEALTSINGLNKAFIKKFSEAEEKLAAPHWTAASFYWMGASGTLGYTTQNALNTTTNELTIIQYLSPSFMVSGNMFRNGPNSIVSFYGNIYIKADTKNSFTGKDPVSWNRIGKIDDSTILIQEKKDVFNYDPKDYSKKFLPTIGAQAILMIKDKVGLDISVKHEWLVKSSTEVKAPQKTNQSYGLVFPFNDKDGERTINIEVFYSHDTFNLASLSGNDFWGAKFSIPMFSK